MNKEEFEAMTKLQQKAIRYKNQLRTISAFNDDEYYAHILFNLIKNIRKENINLKQALNEIRKYCEDNAIEVNTREYGNLVVTNTDDILQIIDKVLGGSNNGI